MRGLNYLTYFIDNPLKTSNMGPNVLLFNSEIFFQVDFQYLTKITRRICILILFTYKIIKELNLCNSNYTKNKFCTVDWKKH